MSQMYILKEVEAVTKIAKNIFGDIVSKVYYADVYDEYLLNDKNQIIQSIDYSIKNAFNFETSIEQDGKNIVIEFTNGRKVIFSNSEWGSMESFSDSEIKNIV